MNTNVVQCPKCWENFSRPVSAAQAKCPKCGAIIRIAPTKPAAGTGPAGKPAVVKRSPAGNPGSAVAAHRKPVQPAAPISVLPADPFAGPPDPFAEASDPFAVDAPAAPAARPKRRRSWLLRGFLFMMALLLVGGAGAALFFWDRVNEEVASLRARLAQPAAPATAPQTVASSGEKMEPDLLEPGPMPDTGTPPDTTGSDAPIVAPEVPPLLGPDNPGFNLPLLPGAGPALPKASGPGNELPPDLRPKLPAPSPDAVTKTKPKDDPALAKSAIADEYKAIKTAHDSNLEKLQKAFREAKTVAERQRVQEQIAGLFTYPTRMLELGEKNLKDPMAPDALVWAAAHTRQRAQLQRAVELVMKEYVKSPRIAGVCLAMIEGGYPEADAALVTILEKNANREVRAYACLALGIWFKVLSDQGGFADTAEKAKKGEEYLERVVNQFDDVTFGDRTLGEAAKPLLQEMRTLGIGKVAPDVEGTDSTGKPIKLSDFRGKVTVVNFWATWSEPCVALIPQQRQLVKRLTGKKFAIFGVSFETSPGLLKKVEADNQINWRSAWVGQDGARVRHYNIRFLPTIFVLDHKGVIRYKGTRGAELDAAVDALLQDVP